MSIKNKLLSFIFRHNSENIDKDNDQAEFDYSEDTYSNDSDFNILRYEKVPISKNR